MPYSKQSVGCDDGNTLHVLSYSKMNYTIRLSVADMITPIMINLLAPVLTEKGPNACAHRGSLYLICEFLMVAVTIL